MPEFTYHAIDRTGVSVHGAMLADNEWKLEERLQEIGYWLIEAEEASRRRKPKKVKVPRRELIDFFNGLSTLLHAGVPAVDAFKAMIEETENESFKHVLEDIEVSVQAGNSIYDAISKHTEVFSEQICNLVHAGEFSGNLAITFEDISSHLEWVDRLMADVKQASIYPLMVIFAVGGLITLLLSFVVPKFTKIFEDIGLTMPALTKLVIKIGEVWWVGLLIFIALFVVIKILVRYVPKARLAFDNVFLNIPIFGSINRMLIMSRFVHNLELMIKAGVPILQALSLCRNLVASPVMESVIRDAEIAVNEGRKMSEALREHSILSPMVLRMVVVGEETGRLDDALSHVSKRFDQEIPRRIKRAFSILEPIIIMILIIVVGIVVSAVFLPMLSLMSGLNS